MQALGSNRSPTLAQALRTHEPEQPKSSTRCDSRKGQTQARRKPMAERRRRTTSLAAACSKLLGLLVSLPVVVADKASFADKASLQAALAEWCSNQTSAELAHGHISTWDTGKVTDMSGSGSPQLSFLGSSCSTFNEPIGSWDVSSVTSMDYMLTVSPGRCPIAPSHTRLPASLQPPPLHPRAPQHPSPPPPVLAGRQQLQPAAGLECCGRHGHGSYVRCTTTPLL